MDPLIPCIWVAGILQLLIASSNFLAARKLDYRANLARVTPIVRDIFWVQNLYIELVLVAFALLCFLFPEDLAGRTALGRFLSGFLVLFWGLRLLIQGFFYDPATRREYPLIDRLFLVVQAYLTVVFAVAVSRAWEN